MVVIGITEAQVPNPHKLDLAGKRYGRLLVIRMDHINKHQQTMWLCRCDCGNKTISNGSTLKDGRAKSCGCWKADVARKQETTHGLSRSPEYRIYAYMKQRCLNPNYSKYHLWGGKGVKICKRWIDSFENFYADMGRKPSPRHSLDRYPDSSGDYKPSNVRWATASQQNSNRRSYKRRWKKRPQQMARD